MAAKSLKELLAGTGLTVSTAESCTGGMIAHMITSVSGSSEYFIGSVVSYAIRIKEEILGVPSETINQNGVVSSQVAAAMAEGVRRKLSTDYAVATTGWADKYGDDHEPAGTVWIGISGPNGTKTLRFQQEKSREENIEAFAALALQNLVNFIGQDLK